MRLIFTSDSRASMGSGRGDRNQDHVKMPATRISTLQWGPVVVTGIRRHDTHLP